MDLTLYINQAWFPCAIQLVLLSFEAIIFSVLSLSLTLSSSHSVAERF